jgi:CheY-like chemotaxis protein
VQAPPAEKPLLGCRLLIVEDNFFVAQTIIDAVQDAGAQVIGPFSRMVDALEHLTGLTAIDGAILDVGLEEEESYPLAEALRTTQIPFMFLTGVAKHHLPSQFARTPHMAKPFSGRALVGMLVEIGVQRN